MTTTEKAKSYLARYALPTGSRQNESQEYSIIRDLLNEQHELVRQQEEITDMCIVSWVSTMGTLKEKVLRLIQWETAIALDPAVSSDAQELITRGRKEAEHQIVYICDQIVDICDDLIARGCDDEIGMLKYTKSKIRESLNLEI